jgi:hypothetical protein
VNEHVGCAVIWSDKAEALVAVEPFHSSLRHTFLLLSIFHRMSTDIPVNRITGSTNCVLDCGRMYLASAPTAHGAGMPEVRF